MRGSRSAAEEGNVGPSAVQPTTCSCLLFSTTQVPEKRISERPLGVVVHRPETRSRRGDASDSDQLCRRTEVPLPGIPYWGDVKATPMLQKPTLFKQSEASLVIIHFET